MSNSNPYAATSIQGPPVQLAPDVQAAVDRLRGEMPNGAAAAPLSPVDELAGLQRQLDALEAELGEAKKHLDQIAEVDTKAKAFEAERVACDTRKAAIGLELEALARHVREVRQHVPQQSALEAQYKNRARIIERMNQLAGELVPAPLKALPQSTEDNDR